MTAAPPARRRRRFARAGVALGAGLLFAALVAEGGARLVHRARGAPFDPAAARERAAAARDGMNQANWRLAPHERRAAAAPDATTLHPYLGYDSNAMAKAWAERAAATRASDPSQVFELGIVGGSVSCILVHDSGARIARALEADPALHGRRVRIHVLGQGALKQPQQAMVVAWALALGWRLDAIVNVDGFNDVAIANQNVGYGSFPLYPSYPTWAFLVESRTSSAEAQVRLAEMVRARATAERALDAAVGPGASSAVLGPLLLARAERALTAFRAASGEYASALQKAASGGVASGPPHRDDLHAVLDTAVTAWAACSRSIAAMCRENGITYVHVLQPTLHDTGAKPMTDEEREVGRAIDRWVDACREGYPRLRQAGRELAARGVHFVDASRIFEDVHETLYYDPCHFVAAGSDLLADQVSRGLLDALAAPRVDR